MIRVLAAAAAVLMIAGPAPAFAPGGERIELKSIGISIEKPDGWTVVPPATVTQSLLSLDIHSEQFRRAVETNGLAPLLTIAKYPAVNGGSIPSVKIQYMAFPLRDYPLIDLARRSIETMRKAYGEVTVIDSPADIMFAGMPAAYRKIGFSVGHDGRTIPTVSEMWVIRRGDYLFMIGANYDPDIPATTQAEIRAAIASIAIRAE